MICYYLNSAGIKIDFMRYPYHLITGEFFDYEWEEMTYSNKIYGFGRRFFEKDLKIDVFCRKDEFAEAMNALEDAISVDRLNNAPGRLYVNGEYLSCFIKAVKKEEWEAGVYTIVTLSLISDMPFWISEEKRTFYRQTNAGANSGLDYPFDYNFEYMTSDVGIENWYINSAGACPFTLIIYGPVTNPRLLVNGHPYEVFTTLEVNEHLILDTRTHQITKYLSNGTTESLYNNRLMEQSVFDPIGPGAVTIAWPGTFGFDIDAYIERSEPLWR